MTRILVNDDEPQITRTLPVSLHAPRYDAAVARRRPDAAVGRECQPDVVVLDLGRPDLDGVEVIHGRRGPAGAVVAISVLW